MPSCSITSPPSISDVTSMPSKVPQSVSPTMTSWATSTRRLVRYPEFAVFKAVSARPLRAPLVEMKYWRTVRPSRKLLVMGVSMISPEGLAMRPLMPASCLICCALPLAPEWAMMNIGLRLFWYSCLPSGAVIFSDPSSLISSSAILSVTSAQMSITLLYRSPSVIRPSEYWFWTTLTSS